MDSSIPAVESPGLRVSGSGWGCALLLSHVARGWAPERELLRVHQAAALSPEPAERECIRNACVARLTQRCLSAALEGGENASSQCERCGDLSYLLMRETERVELAPVSTEKCAAVTLSVKVINTHPRAPTINGFEIKVNRGDTVQMLMQRIEQEHSIPWWQQRMIRSGMELERYQEAVEMHHTTPAQLMLMCNLTRRSERGQNISAACVVRKESPRLLLEIRARLRAGPDEHTVGLGLLRLVCTRCKQP